MANYVVEKQYHFYAAHRNQEVEGKCKSLHGHTYKVFVGLGFNADYVLKSKGGVTILFEDIDKIIEPRIKGLDHSVLVAKGDLELIKCANDYPGIFSKIVTLPFETTSVENFAKYFYDLLQNSLLAPFVIYVDVKETESSRVRFTP